MCGINFIIDKQKKLDVSSIKKMNTALVHRGPDAKGVFFFESNNTQVFFGHTRLKILDLDDDSNQPFSSEDGRYVLSYNGEIYNYLLIKKALEKEGVRFKTQSDTEVLLQFLIHKGIDKLYELDGMFAFVFYDKVEQTMVLARDRNGVKPLYYFENESYFIASSELKAFFESGLVDRNLNERQVANYLTYKHALKPETLYKGVMELEEGALLIGKNNSLSKSYIVSPSLDKYDYSDDELCRKTEEALFQSVEKQIKADVPVGLLLSGGVDSTLLLAVIQELGYTNLPLFTATNSKSEKNIGTEDYIYAEKAQKEFGGVLNPYSITIDDFNLQNFVASLDQPVADSAAWLTYQLTKKAKNQVKVLLSGAGADEWFAGYNRHQAFQYHLKYLNNPLFNNAIWKGLLQLLPDNLDTEKSKQIRLLKKWGSSIASSPEKTYLNFVSNLNLSKALKTAVDFPQLDEPSLKGGLQYDRSSYLIGDIFAITDKMSMQNSVEVRVPYVGNELTQLVNSIDQTKLLKNGRKWVLKNLLEKRGGEKFTKRKKEGLGIPLTSWLEDKNSEFFHKLQIKNNPIYQFVDFETVNKMIQSHLTNKKDYGQEIWSLVVLGEWITKEFE